jgi:tetratricopeptide (TPR) repeat protein
MNAQVIKKSYDTPDTLLTKIQKIENTQNILIESLKSINDHNKNLIIGIGGIIAILVAIQGFTTFVHLSREKKQDAIDRMAVEPVSKIMTVVQQTLEYRLTREKEEHEQTIKLQLELDNIRQSLSDFNNFHKGYNQTKENAVNLIEIEALELAQKYSRHDFKNIVPKLDSFSQRFDSIKIMFALSEEFSSRVFYILGIAAHFLNKPELAGSYLIKVTTSSKPLGGESIPDFERRIANSFYFLGLLDSNFGNNQDAINYFEKANKLDSNNKDFLTKIVIAESYIMNQNWEKAEEYINLVEIGVKNLPASSFKKIHQRLLSRAFLLKTNILIIRKQTDWLNNAEILLNDILQSDPDYYFARATLGQVLHVQGNIDESREEFNKTFSSILNSGDLFRTTETRSRILLLMVAAMCSKIGVPGDPKSKEYLDEAENLWAALPQMNTQKMTVFSIRSKMNENGNENNLKNHINEIRAGIIIL